MTTPLAAHSTWLLPKQCVERAGLPRYVERADLPRNAPFASANPVRESYCCQRARPRTSIKVMATAFYLQIATKIKSRRADSNRWPAHYEQACLLFQTPLKIDVLQVLMTLLLSSNICQYRSISPLLLTLRLTIADASFHGSGYLVVAWFLSNRHQRQLSFLAYVRQDSNLRPAH